MRPASPVTNMSVLREEGAMEGRDEERKKASDIVKTRRRNKTRKEVGTVTTLTVSQTIVFASPALNCLHSIQYMVQISTRNTKSDLAVEPAQPPTHDYQRLFVCN